MPKHFHIVLIGPPGAGKSTVSSLLADQVPLDIIATGQRLRSEIEAGTQVGLMIGPLLEQGHFAPDALMDSMLHGWLAAVSPEHSFILDGYPRTPHQAQALEQMLRALGHSLDAVVALELGEPEAVRRLAGRRVCRTDTSDEPWTLHIDDQAAVERCAAQNGVLELRDDDQPEVILERLRVYERETEPLIAFYANNGLLRRVDAHGEPATVAERVLAAL